MQRVPARTRATVVPSQKTRFELLPVDIEWRSQLYFTVDVYGWGHTIASNAFQVRELSSYVEQEKSTLALFASALTRKGKKKTKAPRIPAWSPTVVLTGRHSG